MVGTAAAMVADLQVDDSIEIQFAGDSSME